MSDSDSLPQQNVLEADWDYLIVLDAARYDVFADIYEEYLDGELTKVRSSGSATPEWATRTFTGDHELTYLSANPFINSLGIPLNELKWGASSGYEWTATEHIDTIVDLWQDEWDENLGAIAPQSVTEAARRQLETGYDGRLVVHYLQPHAPFIQEGTGRKMKRIKAGFDDVPAAGNAPEEEADSLGGRLRRWIEPKLGNSELAQRLGMLVELDAGSTTDILTDGIEDTLRGYYEDNLRLALAETAELVEELDGDVVVTSDHGEAFGEQGIWEHHIETYIPPLIEVPWLEVK
ncbi:MAG: hypothetical protein V5A26_04250 [Halodesulfurarchaeum sp.]|nr:hypothetical protein [Halodesulfurarchaeum sp.]